MAEITEQQRDQFIKQCIDSGMALSEIQKELAAQFDLHLTYMELRLIASDMAVSWDKQDAKAEAAKPKTPAKPAAAKAPGGAENPYGDADDGGDAEPPMGDDGMFDDDAADGQDGQDGSGGKTTIQISQIVRPGTSLSGTVKFGSGASGEWYVDGMGRLGYEPDEGSSKPTGQDLREFQAELRKALGGY